MTHWVILMDFLKHLGSSLVTHLVILKHLETDLVTHLVILRHLVIMRHLG